MSDDFVKTAFDTVEDLHPDLQRYIRDLPGLGPCLIHPYVYSVPYFGPPENRMLNKRYALKSERIAQARMDENWSRFVVLHEKPYRANALAQIHYRIDNDEEYWSLVGDIWIHTENVFECRRFWKQFWHCDRPDRHMAMDAEDREALAAMPDLLTIYRGVINAKGIPSYSWTLDPDVAYRIGSRPSNGTGSTVTVARGVIPKRRVLAYYSGRNEEEIVISRFRHVRNLTTETRNRCRGGSKNA